MSVVDDSPIRAVMTAPAEQDLGPLAWVLDELRKSLEAANKAVGRFVRDADAARVADLETLDTSALRIARQQLHQACGALEMVGLGAPAQIMRSMEDAVNRFIQRPELCTAEAAATLERTHFALMEFLETMLAGKEVSAVALFPQYREVATLAGNDKVHPGDLWPAERRAREPDWVGAMPAALEYGPAARALFDGVVLRLIKSEDREASAQMRDLCLRLAAGKLEDVTARSFWKIAAAFFDAQAHGLIAVDLYVKRMASRVLMQYASMAKGDSLPPARLLQDLMFFCAQAKPRERSGEVLKAVQQAYSMDGMPQVDYQVARFGRHDPAVLILARKRIAAVADTWSALAGGERGKIKLTVEQFGQVAESLVKLQPASQGLARTLIRVAETVDRIGQPPPAELAMEVATAVLYLQAVFATFNLDEKAQASQFSSLVYRLDAALQGAPAQPLEPWMEELFRQASDDQTMGSVVGELRSTLGESERQLDMYFRNPADTSVLAAVPHQMSQMRGVLSVLGFDQAAFGMQRMREKVEQLILGEVREEQRAQAFEKLGNSLGAMGFLIDMLSYQRNMARKLFIYDEEADELRVLMGRNRNRSSEPFKPTVDISTEDSAPEIPAQTAVSVTVPEPFAPEVHVAVAEQAIDSVVTTTAADPVAAEPMTAVLPVEELQPPAAPVDVDLGQMPDAAVAESLAPSLPAPAPVSEPAPDALGDAMAQVFAGMHQSTAAQPEAQEPLAALDLDLSASPSPVQAVPDFEVPAFVEPALSVQELDGEDELLFIFLEEAREVVENGLHALRVLEEQAGSLSEQTTLRRAFHTLKGSSRMVGLDEFGEAGWALEQMLNAWLAEQKPMPAPMRALAVDALKAFAAWAQDLEARQAEHWSATPFRAAADAMRLTGQRADVALMPRRARRPEAIEEFAPLAPEAEALDTAAPAAPAEPQASAEPAASAELGWMLELPEEDQPEGKPEERSENRPTEAAAEALLPVQSHEPHAFLPALDFDVFLPASAEAPLQQPGGAEETADAAVGEVPASPDEAQELDFADFEIAMRESELAALDAHAPVVEPEPESAPEPEPETLIEQALESAPQLLLQAAPAVDFADFEVSETEPAAKRTPIAEIDMAPEVPEQPTPEQPAAPEDDYKHIDGLRISTPLYNVYLHEADEWSERLRAVLQQWSLDLSQPVPEDAVALAHSLAGSSGTVGFKPLSELARLLEHTLQHLQSQGFATQLQASCCVNASEEIRRLLHQFAAGFLKTAQPSIAEELQALLAQSLELTEVPPALEVSELDLSARDWSDLLTDLPAKTVDPLDLPLDFAAQTLESAEPQAADPVLDTGAQTPELPQAPAVYSAMPRPVGAEQEADLQRRIDAAIALAVHAETDDDEIDVLDQVDPDLFPIFEEEAVDLLPKLGAALRRWHARPLLDDARKETLRALHTLKGSARLAGAMRMGEMAHRLESAVERVDGDKPSAESIDPLLARFDALQASFDVLRVAGEQDAEPPLDRIDDAVIQAPLHLAAESAATAAAQAQSVPADAATASSESVEAEPQAFAFDDELDAQAAASAAAPRVASQQTVRVRAQLLDRLISQAGEVLIARSRVDSRLAQARASLGDLTLNLERLRSQLRDIEVQAESQMQSRLALSKDSAAGFDPLEFDRFTRVQELTRMMAESVNDVATVQRNLQRDMIAAEDDLVAQGRQARDLQRDLLRTRMVEFESLAERLYAVVRQTSKEMGKQVRLNILGGTIEMDRGMLERMMPAFEHLLRNCVAHGIESPEQRQAAGKSAVGTIEIILSQERNDVALSVEDDGAGLNLESIRSKAISQNLWAADQHMGMEDAGRLIFESGFSTATEITGVAGRGIGMDVVRSEVNALGGRIETHSEAGRGSAFRLVLPLTTAVTQVVMLRVGKMSVGVPASLVEIVRRTPLDALGQAYQTQAFHDGSEVMPFYWAGALWQSSLRSEEAVGRTRPVLIVRSASQRIALHVDEVLGNQEVVIKNLGPQLARLPGLTGMSVLPSGAVVQIYNPVALANVYGDQVRALAAKAEQAAAEGLQALPAAAGALLTGDAQASVPLVLVVDDSITVRRVTQRLLQREGYRVALAADGLQAIEVLQDERPTVVLSDIEMPRMDGFDLLRNIRADQRLKGMPVIMITSRIAQKHREMAAQLGANHYLGKPYADEELLGLIQHYALQRSGPAPESQPLHGGTTGRTPAVDD
ncbi:Hpt domain-containing protein [Comamonas aquatilis]|uniref:hybrid sensor histidine kinase/response regulator n=1 Tax=Comamonas aquatilis TaxID=1778406 RepID=UPI0039F1007E